MTDSFESIWNEVHGHSLVVDPLLVQSWVRDTWREIAESRTWSWLRKQYVWPIDAPYSTGTVECTPGDTLVTFTGATLTSSMAGRQFRIGSSGIYDITSVDTAAGTAQIWPPWADSSAVVTLQSYKIFTAYLTPPDSEFFAWVAVTNPATRKRLRLHVNQDEIDYHDAARLMTSIGPSCLSGVDWTRNYDGRVYPTLQVVGSGPGPVSSGSYTGQTDSLYVITITTGGARAVAKFSYRKDTGAEVLNNSMLPAGNTLPDGVGLAFPNDVFILNNVFVVRVSTRPQYGVPRYEIYPHPTTNLVLHSTYATRVHDIDEAGFVLPYTMRGDLVKLGALAKMARYPGTEQKPNPYSQIARAQFLEDKFALMLNQLEVADDYLMETNVMSSVDQWELALLPWMTTSGSGLRPTADYDPRDMLI